MRLSSIALAISFLLATAVAFPVRPDESSLTSKLQREVDRAMGKLPGAFVVVDVASRTILAAHRMDLASLRLEAPGSTLKPFVLMTLLETGKLDPKHQFICRRPLQIGSARMDCTHPAAVAELDTASAVAYSCNSYIADKNILKDMRRRKANWLRSAAKDMAKAMEREWKEYANA
jgi:hypothetical protein